MRDFFPWLHLTSKKTFVKFAFCVVLLSVSANDEHTKPRSKRELLERNYASSSGSKATGIFLILLSQDGFESDSP